MSLPSSFSTEHPPPAGLVYQFVLHPDGTASFPFLNEGCSFLLGLAPG
ncbi:histidine kinase, partial [Acinetobacter baumannii]|nr:histidine kinase [Acinetobacter baumannii]